jgi:hypothetical protein
VLSVGSIFYCGLIMFGIMLAFFTSANHAPCRRRVRLGRARFRPNLGILYRLGATGSVDLLHGIGHHSCRHLNTRPACP